MDMTRIGAAAVANDVEAVRLATLTALDLLDTPPEPAFDTVARTARNLFRCKIGLISLVDDERQWFKARCGLDIAQTSRALAFCSHAVTADDELIVPDATADPRFRDNPLVTGAPRIRFYAGIPIRTARPGTAGARHPVGTLCVIDDAPREPAAADLAVLRDLAQLVEALIDARYHTAIVAQLAEERRHALHTLDRTLRQFRQAERIANIGSWRLTFADQHIEWSEQTYAIHGLEPGAPNDLDVSLRHFLPDDRALVTRSVERTIATGEPFDVEIDFITAQGDRRRVRSMGELESEAGVPQAVMGVFQDITERHRMEQALRQTVATDELTRVASRGRFNEMCDELIERARDAGAPLALLLIDLDHFKSVNDLCGHSAGDDLLRLMASRLQAAWLGNSFAARLGGDEFVLLVSDPELLADLPRLLGRLLGELRHTVSCGGNVLHASATIGAGRLDPAAASRSELLHRADAALYRAKRSRRGSAAIDGHDGLIFVAQG